MIRSVLFSAPVLCCVLLSPGAAAAQKTGYYVRVAPGLTWTSIRHTQEVNFGNALPSITTGSASGIELGAHLAGGFRGQRGLRTYLSFEVEAVLYVPNSIDGKIASVGDSVPLSFVPEEWDYGSKLSLGANVVLERVIGGPTRRLLLFAGVARVNTEVAVGGTNKVSGEFQEDRSVRGGWPFRGGVGLAAGPVYLRLNYSRSLISWSDATPQVQVLDKWGANAVTLTLGVGVF